MLRHGCAVFLVLAACGTGSMASDAVTKPTVPEPAGALLRFEAITIPSTMSDELISSTHVVKDGLRSPVAWRPLLREGQRVGGATFGLLHDKSNRPMRDPYCGSADFGGLLQAHGHIWHAAHMECRPGALWFTRLTQDAEGALAPVLTRSVDLRPVGGGSNFCGGMITPWSTLLSTEEYEPDARRPLGDRGRAVYAKWDPSGRFQPYDFGWVPESRVLDDKGNTSVVKHYAMGRFSHEVALVLPDRRTVYLSDDATNGGLFLFIADAAGDMSAGVLYAARWSQKGDAIAELSWVSLGHATDSQVGAVLRDGLRFSDLYDASEPPCRPGYDLANTAAGAECLRPTSKVPDPVRARLETRREAARAGATTELTKSEGLVYDEERNTVYLALAVVGRGMRAQDPKWDAGGPDHIGVKANRCGGVYSLKLAKDAVDTSGAAMNSALVAKSASQLWMGREVGEGCAPDGLAGPDNLAFIPQAGLLMVAEDTGHHANNLLWALDVQAVGEPGAAVPILAVPPGAEVTGVQWFDDVGGHAYLTATVQHPWARTPQRESRSREERMGTFGYFGPFPK